MVDNSKLEAFLPNKQEPKPKVKRSRKGHDKHGRLKMTIEGRRLFNKELSDKIWADFMTGEFTGTQIAERYKISATEVSEVLTFKLKNNKLSCRK